VLLSLLSDENIAILHLLSHVKVIYHHWHPIQIAGVYIESCSIVRVLKIR
jgi:hypothetical protein